MKVTIGYIEEPSFGWTDPDRTATGAEVDPADALLRAKASGLRLWSALKVDLGRIERPIGAACPFKI